MIDFGEKLFVGTADGFQPDAWWAVRSQKHRLVLSAVIFWRVHGHGEVEVGGI